MNLGSIQYLSGKTKPKSYANIVDFAWASCYYYITLYVTANYLEKGNTVKLINPETKTFRVFQALQTGEALTSSKAKKMGIGNLNAEVHRIRQHGFAVYTNKRTAGNGVRVTEYVLGKPSRNMVALAYKAQSLGITL